MSVGRILQNQTRDDERRAYTELIKKYSKLLFDFGYRLCQNDDLVKDCMQQLFLDLWNKNFNLSRENTIKSYLLKAIRNRILREKAKWNNLEQLDEDYDFVLEIGIETKLIDHITDCELAAKLEKILNALPPRQREIVYLKFYEDLDAQQISTVMNITPQSVHNLLQKAYQSIRVDWQVLVLFVAVVNIK